MSVTGTRSPCFLRSGIDLIHEDAAPFQFLREARSLLPQEFRDSLPAQLRKGVWVTESARAHSYYSS